MNKTKKDTISVIKHENERINKDISESCKVNYIIALKWCKDKFYLDEEETELYQGVKEFYQDKYNQTQDIIDDLLNSQLGLSSAYTSSSSLAGFHYMENDATLIFRDGRAFLVCDEEETANDIKAVLEVY